MKRFFSLFLILLSIYTLSASNADGLAKIALQGINRTVGELAVSPDGKYIVFTDFCSNVHLYRTDGFFIRSIDTDIPWVYKVGFSPDSGSFYVCGGAGEDKRYLGIWDLLGNMKFEQKAGDSVTASSADFNYDGSLLAVEKDLGDYIEFVEIINLKTNEIVQIVAGTKPQFLPKNKGLICIWNNMVWDDEKSDFSSKNPASFVVYNYKFEKIQSFSAFIPDTKILEYAISPDGTQIAAAYSGFNNDPDAFYDRDGWGRIDVWSIDGDHRITLVNNAHRTPDVSWAGNGNLYGSIGIINKILMGPMEVTRYEGQIRVWNSKLEHIKDLSRDSNFVPGYLDTDKNSNIIAGDSSGITIWDSNFLGKSSIQTSFNHFTSISMSPDGETLALGSSRSKGGISIWNTNGRYIKSFAEECYPYSIKYSNNMNIIIQQWTNVFVYNLHGELIINLYRDMEQYYGPSGGELSAQGLIIGDLKPFDADAGTAGIYNEQGEMVLSDSELENAESMFFNSTGSLYVVKPEYGPLLVKDLQGNLIRKIKLEESYPNCLRLSPDGNYLYTSFGTSTGDKSFLINLDTSTEIELLNHRRWGDYAVAAEFSHNGKYLAQGGEDNLITVYNMNGDLLATFHGHEGSVTDLDFSPDDRLLYSSSVDGTFRIWSIENGHSASVLGWDGEWLIVTPDGYYDGSTGASFLANIVDGMDVYSLDQVSLLQNRPDIIYDRLGLVTKEETAVYRNLYLQRLALGRVLPLEISTSLFKSKLESKLTIDEKNEFFRLYRLQGDEYILNKRASISDHFRLLSVQTFRFFLEDLLRQNRSIPLVTVELLGQDDGIAEISVDIAGLQGSELESLNIYLNGSPYFPPPGIKISGHHYNNQFSLELVPGENVIEVRARDKSFTRSLPIKIVVNNSQNKAGNLYFLGFGVSGYDNSDLDLIYPTKDILDMEKVCLGMDEQYANVFSRVWIDQQCNFNSIKSAESFLSEAGTNDTVVILLSGHGLHDSKDINLRYYFIPYGVNLNNLAQTAIPFTEFEKLLSQTPAVNKLFLLDTCESGLAVIDQSPGSASMGISNLAVRSVKGLKVSGKSEQIALRIINTESDRSIFRNPQGESGSVIISSSGGGEPSFEPGVFNTEGNGFFTGAVIDSLQNILTDLNGNGSFNALEIMLQTWDRVQEQTLNLQNPSMERTDPGKSFSFPTPPHLLHSLSKEDSGILLLRYIESSNINRAVELLDMDYDYTGQIKNDAVISAIQNNNYDMLKLLLDNDFPVDSRNQEGETAMELAVYQINMDMIELLGSYNVAMPAGVFLYLESIGDFERFNSIIRNENKINYDGLYRVLSRAIGTESMKTIKQLIQIYIDYEPLEYERQDPWDSALDIGNPEIITMFIDAGRTLDDYEIKRLDKLGIKY